MHSIAFLLIAPDIAFASVFEVGTSHRTLKYCWTQSIAFLSIAPDIAFALVFEVGAKATFSAAQLHARPCKRPACQFYIMLMPTIIFIIIIIINIIMIIIIIIIIILNARPSKHFACQFLDLCHKGPSAKYYLGDFVW